MRSYLGIDAHTKTGLELALIDAVTGEVQWQDRCPLHRTRLREAVQRAARPCTVVFEQGELATWLHIALTGTCERIIAADARRNRLIATSPDKSDPFDAVKLAELARGGYVHEIYQPPRHFQTLRLRVQHHYRLQRHATASKNQIKAMFRQQGIPVSGASVYTPSKRAQWLALLSPPARAVTEDLYAVMDVVEERKKGAEKLLARAAARFPATRRFCQIPYVGPVTATTFAAFIVTPERFPSRSHMWSYCGFGLTRRSSGSTSEPVRIRRKYNRALKRVIKSSVERMVWQRANPFALAYQQRVAGGMLPTRAKLTVARKLIDVMCAIWSKERDYDPSLIRTGP